MPSSRRSDQTQILLGGDPLEADQVVEGGSGDRRRVHVELVERLGHRERRALQAGPGVRCVTRGDLGLDQRAQELLGLPALGLGHHQQFGRQTAHGAEAESPQPCFEVRRESGRGRAHDSVPMA